MYLPKPVQELAESYGMTVTEAHRFPDYIPLYKAHMERIIDETYQNTRGEIQETSCRGMGLLSTSIKHNDVDKRHYVL